MSNLIEHAERAEVARLEAIFEQEPQCESMGHDDPSEVHGGPATHVQQGPCPHAKGLRCAPHVANVRQYGARCVACRLSMPPESFSFVEL